MSNTPLRSLAPGATVRLLVNGAPTPFLVVQQGSPDPALYDAGCDGSWLLAQNVLTTRPFHTAAGASGSNYQTSDLHRWLQQDFWAQLDPSVQALVCRVRIPWCESPDHCLQNQVHTGSDGLEAAAFLPSLRELGIDEGLYAPADGARLRYFEEGQGASACQKRTAALGTTPTPYWTRSLFSLGDGELYTIKADGGSTAQNCDWSGGGVRPLLILSGGAMVQPDGLVVENQPPTAPASLTLPETLSGGSPVLVQWTAGTDPEAALSGYELERSADGGASFQPVYTGSALQYTDTLPSGCTQVQYRVRAVDQSGAASPYTLSPLRTVQTNSAPVLASQTPSGTDLGEQTGPFTLQYTVTDPDDDPVTVEELLDQTRLRRFQAVLGASNTLTVEAGTLAALEAGSAHTLTLTASDGQASAVPYLFHFRRGETPPEPVPADLRLAQPLDTSGRVQQLRLELEGSLPGDALLTVEAANNARDPSPAWEDLTDAVRTGRAYVFRNAAAQAPWALDLHIRAQRGPSQQGGWISGFRGSCLTDG